MPQQSPAMDANARDQALAERGQQDKVTRQPLGGKTRASCGCFFSFKLAEARSTIMVIEGPLAVSNPERTPPAHLSGPLGAATAGRQWGQLAGTSQLGGRREASEQPATTPQRTAEPAVSIPSEPARCPFELLGGLIPGLIVQRKPKKTEELRRRMMMQHAATSTAHRANLEASCGVITDPELLQLSAEAEASEVAQIQTLCVWWISVPYEGGSIGVEASDLGEMSAMRTASKALLKKLKKLQLIPNLYDGPLLD